MPPPRHIPGISAGYHDAAALLRGDEIICAPGGAPHIVMLVVTLLGWVLRLAGKDSLQLRRRSDAGTYGHQSKTGSPLERLF